MLKDDITKWLTLYKRPTIKQTSYDTLLRTVCNYIIPSIGNYEINEVSSDDVMELLVDMQFNRNLSYSTVKKVYDALSEFYRYAYNRHMVDSNLMSAVVCKNTFRTNNDKTRFLNDAEIRRFVSSALSKNSNGDFNYHYGPAMIVYLHTGVRLGELIGIKIDDYNPKTGELHIHSNVECISNYDKNGMPDSGCQLIHQNSPKSIDSDRIIKINTTAQYYLNMYYRRAIRLNSQYIITSPTGKLASPYSMKNTYRYIAKRAGIENPKGIHTLRHTCATHLLRNKVDIKVVSKILGHASVKITYDTYIHLFEDDVPEALSILDSIFSFAS